MTKRAIESKADAPIKAFFCMGEDPEDSEIIFAKSDIEARRRYANQHGLDIQGLQIERKKQFDHYAPGPVPVKELLEDGWFYECTGCGRTINYANDDDWCEGLSSEDLDKIARHNAEIDAELEAFDKRQIEIFSREEDKKRARHSIEARKFPRLLDRNSLRFIGRNAVFCDIHCEQTYRERKARINLMHEKAEIRAAELFPEGNNFKSGRYPYLEAHVSFEIPGFQYPVHWSPQDGENAARPTNADRDRWVELMAQRKKENAGGAHEETTRA